jgi:two-component system response regulator YesN
MWRAILVDDETYVRTELKRLFPWERYRFELVGEAENGRAAMELISAERPDLVITDIRMPEMNGLELIDWISRNYPDIITGVVSAYNDFPFVREAFRLGAVDYLMKAEASPKTAGTFLGSIEEILERRISVLQEQEELAANTAYFQRMAVESFWRDALTRASDAAELETRAQQLGIVWETFWFGLIMIHVSNYKPRWGNNQQGFRKIFEEEIQAFWDFDWNWSLVDFKWGDFVIITGRASEGLPSQNLPVQKIKDIAAHLALDAIEKRTTSASIQFCSFTDLPRSFREVRETNLLRLYHREGQYLEYEDLAKLRQTTPSKATELIMTWERILQGVETASAHDFLESVFQNIFPQSFTPEDARRLALDFVNVLRRVALEHQIRPVVSEMENREPEALEVLEQAETVTGWQHWIENLANDYFISAQTDRKLHVPGSIQKALQYIQSNFTQGVSLEEVATHAGVSKSYLSRIFPEYTGEHFSNYLQRLRIDRAKELLRFTDDCVYEIAAQVGFWNSRYFSTVFHEITGMTPADYRRIKMG